MTKKIVAFIQARMGSQRLPGKSLLPMVGLPLILHVVDRVQSVPGIDEVVVVTSTEPEDDVLAELLEETEQKCFRGDLENVQQRFYDAMIHYKADVIIRVTGDNPLIEPILLERMIEVWKREKVDYVACDPCIPGVGAELFTQEAFNRARALSLTQYSREHVTPPFYQNENLFSVIRVGVEDYLADRSISLTVDTKPDYNKMVKLYERFYRKGHISNEAVVSFLRDEAKRRSDTVGAV